MITLDELTKNMSLFIPKGCGCSGSGDLEDYYTKEETRAYVGTYTYDKATIDSKIASGGTFDPTQYYTKQATDEKFATKEDLIVATNEMEDWVDAHDYISDITLIINDQVLHNGDSINIEGGGTGSTVVVDSEMSSTSTNPVQNKVITAALDALSMDIPTAVSDLDNDAGYITSGALSDYATKNYVDNAITAATQDMATETYVDNAIAEIGGVRVWLGTKAEYLALQTYDNNTIYLTKE